MIILSANEPCHFEGKTSRYIEKGSMKNDNVPISKKVPVKNVRNKSMKPLSTSLESHVNKINLTKSEIDKNITAKVFNNAKRFGNSLDHILMKFKVNVKFNTNLKH